MQRVRNALSSMQCYEYDHPSAETTEKQLPVGVEIMDMYCSRSDSVYLRVFVDTSSLGDDVLVSAQRVTGRSAPFNNIVDDLRRKLGSGSPTRRHTFHVQKVGRAGLLHTNASL